MKQRMLAVTLVVAQFALIAALVFAPRGDLWPVEPPLLVVAVLLGMAALALVAAGLLGLGPALTASPVPRGRGALVTTGVYGVVRHPVYTGLLLGAAALALVGASSVHIVLLGALLILLTLKARWEERMLRERYPEYREYAARVGGFLPGVGRNRDED